MTEEENNVEELVEVVDELIRYEEGEMANDELVPFFQRLIDLGLVYQLQGRYGRIAQSYIDAGLCTPKIIVNNPLQGMG